MIDLEQLRKDVQKLNLSKDFKQSAHAYANLPDASDLAKEYLELREAADALAGAVDSDCPHNVRYALAAYRKATQ